MNFLSKKVRNVQPKIRNPNYPTQDSKPEGQPKTTNSNYSRSRRFGPNLKNLKDFLGYRPVPCSLSSALLSAFSPHNELINFWTHFLPGVEMIRQLWIRNYDFRDPREISMILFMVRLFFYRL